MGFPFEVLVLLEGVYGGMFVGSGGLGVVWVLLFVSHVGTR